MVSRKKYRTRSLISEWSQSKYRSPFLRLGKKPTKRLPSLKITVTYPLDKAFKHISKSIITLKRI